MCPEQSPPVSLSLITPSSGSEVNCPLWCPKWERNPKEGGYMYMWDFPGGSNSMESACQCRRRRFHPWVRKIPWNRKWHPTPVFLPGEFHGQRNLVGYNLWGSKKSDATEQLSTICVHRADSLFCITEAKQML